MVNRNVNPFSRFEFAVLSALPNACSWQAKEHRLDEPVHVNNEALAKT